MRRRRLPFVSATVDAQCLLHGAGQTELQRPSGLDVPLGPPSHRLPIPTPLIIGLGASVGSLESVVPGGLGLPLGVTLGGGTVETLGASGNRPGGQDADSAGQHEEGSWRVAFPQKMRGDQHREDL